jgi:hypothetical protein
MVTIAKFSKSEDAYLFRSFLDAQGIESYIFDEHISQLFWQYTLAFGGIRVVVADEDAEEAEKVYVEYDESMKSAPYVVQPVRAWPLMVIASLLLHCPVMLFGREIKPDDKQDTDPEI